MPTNFLEAAGYLSPATIVGTGNTNTNTTLNALNFNPQTTGRSGGSLLKGQFLTIGGGGNAPDIIAAVASSTSITLLTAATSSLTGTAVKVFNYPVLIGGEASALAQGAAVTSSYWNNTGIFTQTHFDQGMLWRAWFMAGGAFTPALGGRIEVWDLWSWDDGTNFDSVIATASGSVPALVSPPMFTIPLDNAAYATGNVSPMAGRFGITLPPVHSRFRVQNYSGVTMPARWAIFLAPFAVQY